MLLSNSPVLRYIKVFFVQDLPGREFQSPVIGLIRKIYKKYIDRTMIVTSTRVTKNIPSGSLIHRRATIVLLPWKERDHTIFNTPTHQKRETWVRHFARK